MVLAVKKAEVNEQQVDVRMASQAWREAHEHVHAGIVGIVGLLPPILISWRPVQWVHHQNGRRGAKVVCTARVIKNAAPEVLLTKHTGIRTQTIEPGEVLALIDVGVEAAV